MTTPGNLKLSAPPLPADPAELARLQHLLHGRPAWLAASTPARRHDLAGVGVIEPGAAADLCVVDDAGRLLRVLQGGAWVDR